ncbi:hypothetical protein ACS0Y7_15660 [Burkholderia gladioli]|uniref:hypothetical protein n=1 Tax=Burkholderia TaxID=32008 RepID=UPI001424A133|nr:MULTISPECIES: hypothetical protein [Burkholderia]MDN7724917.1 hypothetical protein [Burkholderia gladioli]NIF71002.1 hypothetical protein [Burkholderia sp. Ap-962]
MDATKAAKNDAYLTYNLVADAAILGMLVALHTKSAADKEQARNAMKELVERSFTSVMNNPNLPHEAKETIRKRIANVFEAAEKLGG